MLEQQIDHICADPLIGPLLGVFLEAYHDKLCRFEDAVAKQDNDAIQKVLHSLKGSASMYGFSEIAALCARLEQQPQHDVASLTQAIEDLRGFEKSLRDRLNL